MRSDWFCPILHPYKYLELFSGSLKGCFEILNFCTVARACFVLNYHMSMLCSPPPPPHTDLDFISRKFSQIYIFIRKYQECSFCFLVPIGLVYLSVSLSVTLNPSFSLCVYQTAESFTLLPEAIWKLFSLNRLLMCLTSTLSCYCML